MKTRRLLVIAGVGVALAVVVAVVLSSYWERRQTPFQNAPSLIEALQTFIQDQRTGGRRVPPEVSLEDLLRGGYLKTNDVVAFEGMEVVFNTQAAEGSPQEILIRARTPDGMFICLLGDGSVQYLSRKSQERYEKQRASRGAPDGAADGSQPIRPETNSAPAAVGPRR